MATAGGISAQNRACPAAKKDVIGKCRAQAVSSTEEFADFVCFK